MRDRQACGSCGTRAAEWDPDKGGDRNAYQVAFDLCPGCEQVEAFQANHSSEKHPAGRKIRLLKIEEVSRG